MSSSTLKGGDKHRRLSNIIIDDSCSSRISGKKIEPNESRSKLSHVQSKYSLTSAGLGINP